jgi:Domain of unknown function (DUF4329)
VTATAQHRDDLRVAPVRLRRSWGILVRRSLEVRPSWRPSLTFDPVVGESHQAAATNAFQQRAGHPQEWNPISIEINHEYGGSIYCDGGKHKYTVPNVNLEFTDTVTPSNPPAGKKLTGRYHTHGRDGNDGLSGWDKQGADHEKVPWYVGTPIGTIVKYDPAVGLPQIIIGHTRVPK